MLIGKLRERRTAGILQGFKVPRDVPSDGSPEKPSTSSGTVESNDFCYPTFAQHVHILNTLARIPTDSKWSTIKLGCRLLHLFNYKCNRVKQPKCNNLPISSNNMQRPSDSVEPLSQLRWACPDSRVQQQQQAAVHTLALDGPLRHNVSSLKRQAEQRSNI